MKHIYQTALHLTIKYVLVLTNAIWAIPLVFLIRSINSKLPIKICQLHSERIGHFVIDTFHHIVRRSLSEDKRIELFSLPLLVPPANAYFPILAKRHLPVHWWVQHLVFWNRKIPGGDSIMLKSNVTENNDPEGLLRFLSKDKLFTNDENLLGKAWLRQQGWQEGEKVTCLLVRDSSYLTVASSTSGYDWAYHSYRNSDIESYREAILWLIKQGSWVFRMGKHMKHPLKVDSDRFIDYAFHPDRSDFMDIWLFSNCSLCISTGTGLDILSAAFRVPILMPNLLPLSCMWAFGNIVTFPKHLFHEATGNRLSALEYIEADYWRTEGFKNAGIEIRDLTSTEILEATKEVWNLNFDRRSESFAFGSLNEKFFKALSECNIGKKYHRFIHPEARVSGCWLNLVKFDEH